MRGAAYVKLEMEKQLGKPRHKWEFNVNMKFDITVTAGFTWLSIRFSGGFLWTRKWTFEFQKRPGISWLAERLSVSQEELCPMELLNNIHTAYSKRLRTREIKSHSRIHIIIIHQIVLTTPETWNEDEKFINSSRSQLSYIHVVGSWHLWVILKCKENRCWSALDNEFSSRSYSVL